MLLSLLQIPRLVDLEVLSIYDLIDIYLDKDRRYRRLLDIQPEVLVVYAGYDEFPNKQLENAFIQVSENIKAHNKNIWLYYKGTSPHESPVPLTNNLRREVRLRDSRPKQGIRRGGTRGDMINLIASALGREEEIYGQQMELVINTGKELLSKQETAMVTRLLEDHKTTGTYLHPEAFKREFPELKTAVDVAKTILPDEVKHYTLSLIEKRTRQRTSQELMIIANNVLDNGLKFDDIDRIRSLPLNEEIPDEDEALTFKEKYLKRKEQPLGIQTGIQEIDGLLGASPRGSCAPYSPGQEATNPP